MEYEIVFKDLIHCVNGIGGMKVEIIELNPFKRSVYEKLKFKLAMYQKQLDDSEYNVKYYFNESNIDWVCNIYPFMDEESLEFSCAFFDWVFHWDDFFEKLYNSMYFSKSFL